MSVEYVLVCVKIYVSSEFIHVLVQGREVLTDQDIQLASFRELWCYQANFVSGLHFPSDTTSLCCCHLCRQSDDVSLACLQKIQNLQILHLHLQLKRRKRFSAFCSFY